jgi:hypothetical protein
MMKKFLLLGLLVACGGDPKPAAQVAAPVASAVESAAASASAPAASASNSGGVLTAAPAAGTGPAEEAKVLSFERSKEFGKLDKVGKEDGKLSPDGSKDAVFTLKVSGGVDALFVATVDKKGDSLGEFQADTLVGSQTQPNELAVAKAGKLTQGIAVYDGEKMVNRPDGSISGAVTSGERTLTLYIDAATLLKAGKSVRVWIQMTDHTVVAGPILK